MSLAPIRVVTRLRTGNCPEGVVTSDRIMKPITPEERRAGVRDELREWYRIYGSLYPTRRTHRRHWYGDQRKSVKLERIPNDPPIEIQQTVWDEMQNHFRFVALDLVRSGVISESEIEDVVHDFFRQAIEVLPAWNPELGCLKTFLYEATAANKIDYIRARGAKCNEPNYTRLSIVNHIDATDDHGGVGRANAGVVNAGCIPETVNSVAKLEVYCAIRELAALLDADERLALDYLLAEFEGKEISKMMNMPYSTWRRTVLESLQMKAELCGICPSRQKREAA